MISYEVISISANLLSIERTDCGIRKAFNRSIEYFMLAKRTTM